jgi:hypothetical protein
MSQTKQTDEETRIYMECAGFTLRSADEPGIYVRQQLAEQEDSINWHSEPTELLREVEIHVQHYRDENRAVR